MKAEYESPEALMIEFDDECVIITSGDDNPLELPEV